MKYIDLGADNYDEKYKARALEGLRRRADAFYPTRKACYRDGIMEFFRKSLFYNYLKVLCFAFYYIFIALSRCLIVFVNATINTCLIFHSIAITGDMKTVTFTGNCLNFHYLYIVIKKNIYNPAHDQPAERFISEHHIPISSTTSQWPSTKMP